MGEMENECLGRSGILLGTSTSTPMGMRGRLRPCYCAVEMDEDEVQRDVDNLPLK